MSKIADRFGGALLLNILIWVSRPEIYYMVLKFLACVWSNCTAFVFRVLVHKMNFMTSNIMNNGSALISFNFDGFFLCSCFLDLCNPSFPSLFLEITGVSLTIEMLIFSESETKSVLPNYSVVETTLKSQI